MKKIIILRRKGLGNTSTKAIKAFSKHEIEIIRNDRVIPQDTDLLIRWGCTSQFPAVKTLNKASAISTIGNKFKSRKILKEAGVTIPALYEDVQNDDITYPVIVRPHHHSQGKQLWKCDDKKSLLARLKVLRQKGTKYYVSEYVKKDAEFGVFIFDGRVTSVIEKVAKGPNANDEVAWNVSQGTHAFQNVKWGDWDMKVCKISLDATACFDATFCRVDVIVKDGVPYILELNSAHSLTSEYRQKIFANCLDYYIENGPVKNELDFENVFTYKSIIHPAIRLNMKGKNL